MGVPVAPAHIGEAAEISAERTAGLLLIGRDAFAGVRDLSRELVDFLLRLDDPVLTDCEAGDLELLQRSAVLLELRAVPGNPAVAVGYRKNP